MRSTDKRKQLRRERMVEKIKGCKMKRHYRIGRISPEVCRGKHIFIALLEDGALNRPRRRWP
jgi:hypothetical protein